MPGTKRALFLDWGGTLALTQDNQTDVDAAGNPILMPNVATVLARERPRFDVCFIVSNQPRVATGEISVAEVDRRVAWANERLGRPFTDWRLCPHTDEDGCDCRKPSPGCSSSSRISMASIWRARRTSAMWRRTALPRPRRASEPSSGRATSSARSELGGRPARGKGEADGRSTPLLALDPELAAVREHEVLDDREPEPGAADRHGRRSLVTPESSAHLEPIDHRYHQVEDDKVGDGVLRLAERLGAVRRGPAPEAFALEVQHDEPPDVGLVFDDENVLGQR